MSADTKRRAPEYRYTVKVRVSEREREELAEALAADGLTVSAWLRQIIRDRLGR